MKNNMKWLLLIPVVLIAFGLGFFVITQILGDDNGGDSSGGQDQALQAQIDDLQQRVDAYKTLVTRNPGDLEAVKGAGDSYLEIGATQSENGQVNDSYVSYKNAVDQYRLYLSQKPDDIEVRIDLGLAYSYLNMSDIGVRELRTAVAAAPTNQRAWHSLGWVLYNGTGNLEQAQIAWQKAYDLDPSTSIGQEAKSFLDQFAGQSLALPSSLPPTSAP